MVTQFKDNPFEEQFYEYDKIIAQAEYKRVYYIPELESKLAYCLNNQPNWRNKNHEGLKKAFSILSDEIERELDIVGRDKLEEINKLAIGKFDSTASNNTARFLTALKQFYLNKKDRAQNEKDELVGRMTSTPERLANYERMRNKYQNQAVSNAVKNIAEVRIVEFDGRLIQKIYPIYMDEHKPKHLFDISSNFYQPTKHFAGYYFDTLYFNIAVIWSMTVFLFIALYFDLLKKFILMFERRKHRRRDRN
jgi:hypothetical protein